MCHRTWFFSLPVKCQDDYLIVKRLLCRHIYLASSRLSFMSTIHVWTGMILRLWIHILPFFPFKKDQCYTAIWFPEIGIYLFTNISTQALAIIRYKSSLKQQRKKHKAGVWVAQHIQVVVGGIKSYEKSRRSLLNIRYLSPWFIHHVSKE